ncbi:glycoside hydrolase family 76 protein [Dendrothele bispora CBS 962.96]|uniref:Glycoside hydrolase family 76 protein n=1 Tax=Dendrothele bispora (strain CBS 962.96) TaxID=1314807 RepID=A0A4S8MPW2_DENBC|nr:glycoside hydrolase family 76 protein [Dendrothele bispora CBS 962.96]
MLTISLVALGTLGFTLFSPATAQQCAATLQTALSVAHTLQDHYYNSGNGMYNGGSLWTDANTLEDLHNLMLATGTDDFSTVADNSFIGRSALNANTNWAALLGGSNDDAGWIVLSLWKMADYKRNRGIANADSFMNAAATIYDIIEGQMDNQCGGGVWWSTAHTYKNAITNELFILLSAQGFRRGLGQRYLDNANKVWNWLKNTGMRNAQGLYNDGLVLETCANNGQTTWTYNQGVIASGLAELAAANNDKSLLDQAEITLDATIAHLTDNNILRESCDDAQSGGAVCNADQGIWTKHLQYYLDAANDPARTSKYRDFLGSQESAVFHFGTNANNDVGSVWYAPSQGGSVFTPKTSASGLAAHVAAAKYGPC